jgi:predicted hotdog family 3-hydroxylacyl-ACP dehydratase
MTAAPEPTPWPHVSELVPHGAPMLALEELLEWQPGHARVTAALGPSHPFARRGSTGATVALELMAQGVAACMGMDAYREGRGVRFGMVIACRQLSLAREEIAAGERLYIEVWCKRRTDYASVFDGEARDGEGELVASGSFTLVHGEAGEVS